MTFSTYGLTGYDVQYWNGSSWASVTGGSITGNNKVWRKFTFAPITTSKIRVLTNASPDNYSRLTEVEAWGYSSSPAPILADDFNDNVRDTTKWNLYAVGPNPSPTYEQNGRLEIQSQYSATNSNYGGYVTAATHNLNGKQTSVEVVAPTTANGGGGNYAGLSWGDSPYRIMLSYHYIYYDNTGSIFDPVRDRFIRLRDDPATQTVHYESSSNGSTWEVRASRSRGAASLDYTVRLYNGNTAGWTSFDLVIFDNFRLEASGSPGSGNANINWLVADHLGTPRMIFDKTGSHATVKRHDYLPFGEELFAGAGGRTAERGYTGDTVRQKFTGYERDNETSLDFAQARYYASVQGRFTGVDPLLASASVTDPQSFNRYAYVGNNPLKFVDPSGLSMCSAEFSFEDCGGEAGFWGTDPVSEWRSGGRFGDEFAIYNREYGGMPANAAAALQQHNQRVNNAIGGYGFVTNAELRGIEIHTYIRDPETGQWVYAGGVPLIEDENPFDIFAGGRLDRWPPQWPPPGQDYGWSRRNPGKAPTGTSPTEIRPRSLDDTKKETRQKDLRDQMREVKRGRPGPKGWWGGFIRALGDILKMGPKPVIGPVIWTPEMECHVTGKCGRPSD